MSWRDRNVIVPCRVWVWKLSNSATSSLTILALRSEAYAVFNSYMRRKYPLIREPKGTQAHNPTTVIHPWHLRDCDCDDGTRCGEVAAALPRQGCLFGIRPPHRSI
ncbi:hypothetical protein WG66_002382 [Moniliophthora roreri]|nr:hypothetical protein WG66_002382 [Moniliophthora roreri]